MALVIPSAYCNVDNKDYWKTSSVIKGNDDVSDLFVYIFIFLC